MDVEKAGEKIAVMLFIVAAVFALVMVGILGWGIIELILWITSK